MRPTKWRVGERERSATELRGLSESDERARAAPFPSSYGLPARLEIVLVGARGEKEPAGGGRAAGKILNDKNE